MSLRAFARPQAEVPGMTDLSDLVEPLKRELAVPGQFESVFPSTTDQHLTDALSDGFATAQLQGFFSTYTLTDGVTSEDLSAAGGTLVVLFSAMQILRAQLRSMFTVEKYSAKQGTSVEFQRSANLLRDELNYMNSRLNTLITDAQNARSVTLATVLDNYRARNSLQLVAAGVGGFYPSEWK